MTPVDGPITQKWSPRHQAIDIACIPGMPVRATRSGFGSGQWDYDLGWVFSIGGHRYAHLLSVLPPGHYEVGDTVGFCGSTGRLTTGPHVHWAF